VDRAVLRRTKAQKPCVFPGWLEKVRVRLPETNDMTSWRPRTNAQMRKTRAEVGGEHGPALYLNAADRGSLDAGKAVVKVLPGRGREPGRGGRHAHRCVT
jgi:hypothetical protein